MDCPHAYLKRDIDYLLCDFEPTPSKADRTKLYHAVCGHQAHCPKQNCHKNTSSWSSCVKLAVRPQDAAEAQIGEDVSVPEEAPKKRTRRATQPQSED